jgi:hypothetical protein
MAGPNSQQFDGICDFAFLSISFTHFLDLFQIGTVTYGGCGPNNSILVFVIRFERNTWEPVNRHVSNLVPETWRWREEVKRVLYEIE